MCGDFSLADRPLVVIKEVEPAYLEWTIVRTVACADTAIVSHHVETVFAVNRRVNGADSLTRRVLAMLTRHRLMHDLWIFWPIAAVLVERLPAGVVTVDTEPVHDPAVRHL